MILKTFRYSWIVHKFLVVFGVVLFGIDRLIKDFFVIQNRVCNSGIAFGIHVHPWILFASTLFYVICIVMWIMHSIQRSNYREVGVALCVFLAMLSNILDRIVYGCVIDYLYVTPNFLWFNIADSVIFMGGFVFIFGYFQKK